VTEPNAEVYRDDAGFWRWRVQAANGEIIAVGEAYSRERDAKRGLDDALDTIAKLRDRG
jgi:uncharacterized protein YegP (UPF0339 family)